MRRARLVPLVWFLTTGALPAHGQWQAAAEAGASRLRQSDIPESNAGMLGASLDIFGDRSSLRSNLLATGASAAGWTVQGLVAGSLLGPASHPGRWELTGLFSTFGESGETPTSSGEVMGRARFGQGTRGGAVGLGSGAIAHAGNLLPLFHSRGDAWISSNDEQFVAGVSVVRTSAAPAAATDRRTRGTPGRRTLENRHSADRGTSYQRGTGRADGRFHGMEASVARSGG